MASIDERVVEMTFRRDDFNRGVEETLNGIQKLDDTLAGSGGIADNVKKVSGRFGALGALGFTALNRLGNAAIDAGSKLVSNVFDPIFEGGKKRALSIEQAEFMFRGLGISVEDAMESANNAVLGTAYGLDEAALVAAQFGASGMKAGKDMTTSLRGIAGVAAMTGSSYADIGSIFTTVSGNGRLMTMELRRLEQRGVNAAVEISKYLKEMGIDANATEASVREMVTEGLIDFELFSDAMSHSFGEHATKANEIYTGSLSNMRAALARTGEAWARIKHEKHRRMFNALTPVINAVNKAMVPLTKVYEKFAKASAKKFEMRMLSILENFDWGSLSRLFGGIAEGVWNLKKAFDSIVRPITDAFKAVFGFESSGPGIISTIADLAERFNTWAKSLVLTQRQAIRLKEKFIGFFDTIKMGVIPFKKLGDLITNLGDRFPRFGTALDEMKGRFEEFGGGFVAVIKTISSYIGDFVAKIKDFINGFRDADKPAQEFTGTLERVGAALRTIIDWISGVAVKALSLFSSAWSTIKDGFNGLSSTIDSTSSAFERFISKIAPMLQRLKDAFSGAFSKIGEALKDADPFVLLMAFQTIMSNIISMKLATGFSKLAGGLGDSAKEIGKGLRSAADGISGFLTSISGAVSESKPKQILMLAGAITLLAGSLWLMSTIDTEDLISGGSAIAAMVAILVGALAGITKIIGTATVAKLPAAAAALVIFAGAILIMSAALKMLSGIPKGDLWNAVGVIAALSVVILGVAVGLQEVKAGPIIAAAFGIAILAGALLLLTGVIALLGMLPFDVLVQGGIALGIMLVAIVAAAVILEKHAGGMLLSAVGLMAMALALGMLILPMVTLGLLPIDVLEQGMIVLATVLGGLVLAAMLMSEFAPNMLISAIGLMAMALALNMMVAPILALGLMDYEVLEQGLIGIILALGALVIAAMFMEGAALGALGLIAIAAAMVILAVAIGMLAAIPFDAAVQGLILMAAGLLVMIGAAALAALVLPGILALAALIAVFGFAALAMGFALVVAAIGVSIFAAALPGLASGLTAFSDQAQGILLAIPILALLGLAMIPLAVAAVALGIGMMLLAAAIMILSAGLALLAISGPAGAIALMGFISAIEPLIWKAPKLAILAATLGVLGAAMLVLGAGLLLTGVGAVAAAIGLALLAGAGALAAMAGDKIKEAFSGMEPAIANMTNLGIALAMLGGVLLSTAAAFNTLVGALGPLAGVFLMATAAVLILASASTSTASTVSAAFMTMAAGMLVAGSMMSIAADTIVQTITGMATRVSGAAPAVSGAVVSMVTAMVVALTSGRGKITAAISTIIRAFAILGTSLAKVSPPSAKAVGTMVTSIVRELNKGVRIIPVAITKVINAFKKLAVGINQNRSVAVSAVSNLMSTVASRIASSGGIASSRAYGVGVAISNGMARGIRAGGGNVSAAARGVAMSSLNSAKNALGVRSPSREFYKIAEFVVEGFVDGLEENSNAVENASSALGDGSVEAVKAAFDNIMSQFDDYDQLGMNPVITPVLDLGMMRSQASGIDGMFGLQSIDAQYSRGQADGVALLEEVLRGALVDGEDKPVQKIEYVQNNYSPKALSSSEIYRQTRNQISTASRKD